MNKFQAFYCKFLVSYGLYGVELYSYHWFTSKRNYLKKLQGLVCAGNSGLPEEGYVKTELGSGMSVEDPHKLKQS